MRYLRWGSGRRSRPARKRLRRENCLRLPQNPQRQVHALLGGDFSPELLGVELCTPFFSVVYLKTNIYSNQSSNLAI